MKTISLVTAFYLIFALTFVVGWCINIFDIINTGFEVSQWGGLEILRVVGVFVAPLGSLLGLFS